MTAVSWTEEAREGPARRGWLDTPHGRVRTPAFMSVGTRAAVKAIDVDDLQRVGAEIVLANTYHLMLRPGTDVIGRMGGLHGFMSWKMGNQQGMPWSVSALMKYSKIVNLTVLLGLTTN